ncbi:HAD family hydrolase [Halovivax limisalsi]|uniref:HAD family hydrolase n=1 Tax=Halovivax limisalsi TaxID=1453760 RepID=UPI001FFD0FA9|nr:HAD family hydrolase [Halovivax limisalsi]
MRYDAVCFDLDRTLCVSTQDAEAVLASAFDRVGCEPFCGYDDLSALVPEVADATTDLEFHRNLFERAATDAGVDPAHSRPLAEAYLDASDPAAVAFRDGAESIIERARDRADAVGLITNGSRETQSQKLETLGIADAFDESVFVDPDAGVPPKPDPIPFERALAGLGTEPERTIHVGDTVYADVAGANAAGMDSAWLSPPAGADQIEEADSTHRPTYEFASLDGLSSVL